jgi:hypothetical protein
VEGDGGSPKGDDRRKTEDRWEREGEMKLRRNMDALGIKRRGTIIDGIPKMGEMKNFGN